VSGVNLDEEAADMLKLQQAYQAASQLISTADTMFQTILGAVSR
jgi:flagellar hook-associated protein 1 FlgK